ncbi:MAG: hypothetical protein QNK04_28470 [Myxococcota bacterium]|nr:hypothetical protein [Myxococcota bacterium]
MTARLHATLLSLGDRRLVTAEGAFRAHVFRNLETRSFAVALVRGDVGGREPLLARVHSSCVTSESWRGCDCDCAVQLHGALGLIAAAGRGVLFYLQQEGRGAGFAAKARDRMLVQASRHRLTTFEAYEQMGLLGDHRRYDEVAAACRLLGVRAPLRLLTNNPEKRVALEAEKLAVEEVLPLASPPSPFNLHYLASKSRSGHALTPPREVEEPAEPPETVDAFAPHPLPGRRASCGWPRTCCPCAWSPPTRRAGSACTCTTTAKSTASASCCRWWGRARRRPAAPSPC